MDLELIISFVEERPVLWDRILKCTKKIKIFFYISVPS
jgi:hypothetical protein